MDEANQPGPGRSTSDRAFSELTKEIAQRNEQVHKAARKARTEREQEQMKRRRRSDENA